MVGGSDFSLDAIANVFMRSASDISINLALCIHTYALKRSRLCTRPTLITIQSKLMNDSTDYAALMCKRSHVQALS